VGRSNAGQRTVRNARHSICQKSGSPFDPVVASWVGNSGQVVVVVSVPRRCRLLEPRLWIAKGEAVLLLMSPGLGSCFERKGLYLAVVAAVGHRLVASVGVGGAETVDYARVVVVVVARRKCVPPAAAAFAVVADSTARHSQGLHL